MAQPKTLAELLDPDTRLLDPPDPYEVMTGKQFAEAVLQSMEFKNYVIYSLQMGTLPAAVLTRLMDYAWGKPTEVTPLLSPNDSHALEVRRVIVKLDRDEDDDSITH